MQRFFAFDRRRFLNAGAAAVALAAGRTPAAESSSAAEFVPGKDARLIVHSTKVGEIETPLELLREQRLTPKELLFIRNNQFLADSLRLTPAPLDGWNIELAGLIDRPQTLAATALSNMPQTKREVVLQCSGNGRAWFSRAAKVDGVPWRNGAMGNVEVSGVLLRTVLERLGVRVASAARFVAAEGADAPVAPPPGKTAADFEHSLPLADVLDRSLLVLEMNGEPLPRVHGGPVRFVTPGYYGTMQVKWLSRLRFERDESTNYHQVGRYRTPLRPLTPGASFTSTLENSEPNWNMKIKSVIFAPLRDAHVPVGPLEVRGVAWNDGQAAIDAVDVSSDGGRTWHRATLSRPADPCAWHPWTATLTLAPGRHTLRARAVDALGRTQPLDGAIHWNPAGYAWNGVEEVSVKVG